MKCAFNQVHFNFYDIAAVWKQKDFCVLSFKRACTQALTIGRITRRMGAHLTAFVANETLLKQLKFQGSALYSSTHTYTAVNEPWLSYKMVRSYYAIADVRRIPYKLFQMERAVFENLKVWSLDEAWGVLLRQKRNHEKSIWAEWKWRNSSSMWCHFLTGLPLLATSRMSTSFRKPPGLSH